MKTETTNNLYAERDTDPFAHHYMQHVYAMTREGLHDKSAIAAELAYRDDIICHLRAACEAAAQWQHQMNDATHQQLRDAIAKAKAASR